MSTLSSIVGRQLAKLPDNELLRYLLSLPHEQRAALLLNLEPSRQYLALDLGMPATHEPCQEERLENAAGRGDLKAVKRVIGQVDTDYYHALFAAVEGGHLDVIRLLAPWIRELELEGVNGLTMSMINFLLDIFPEQYAERIALAGLDQAARDGDLALAEYLLPKIEPGHAEYLALTAAEYGQSSFVKWLFNSPDSIYYPFVWLSATKSGNLELVRYLEGVAAADGRLDFLDYPTALENTIYREHLDILQHLLQHYQHPLSSSPIYSAMKTSKVEIIQLLLNHGGEWDDEDLTAAMSGVRHPAVAEWLLSTHSQLGGTTVGQIVANLASGGYLAVAEQLLTAIKETEHRQAAVNRALTIIAEQRMHSSVTLAEWTLSHGVEVTVDVITSAIFNLPMLRLLLPRYSGDTFGPFSRAVTTKQLGAIRLLLPGVEQVVDHSFYVDDEIIRVLLQERASAGWVSPLRRK